MLQLTFKDESYNGVAQKVANFTGKLISIAKQPIQNKNGTPYFPATVEITDDNGAKLTRSCIVYKTSVDKGMTIGESYLGSVTIEAGQDPLVKLTSGTGNANRATLADFGFTAQPATAENANLQSPF